MDESSKALLLLPKSGSSALSARKMQQMQPRLPSRRFECHLVIAPVALNLSLAHQRADKAAREEIKLCGVYRVESFFRPEPGSSHSLRSAPRPKDTRAA